MIKRSQIPLVKKRHPPGGAQGERQKRKRHVQIEGQKQRKGPTQIEERRQKERAKERAKQKQSEKPSFRETRHGKGSEEEARGKKGTKGDQNGYQLFAEILDGAPTQDLLPLSEFENTKRHMYIYDNSARSVNRSSNNAIPWPVP